MYAERIKSLSNNKVGCHYCRFFLLLFFSPHLQLVIWDFWMCLPEFIPTKSEKQHASNHIEGASFSVMTINGSKSEVSFNKTVPKCTLLKCLIKFRGA